MSGLSRTPGQHGAKRLVAVEANVSLRTLSEAVATKACSEGCSKSGEVDEWFKSHAWKACLG